MAEKTATTVIKPRRLVDPAVDPDDVLPPAEGALLKKAEREIKLGKHGTLAEPHHDWNARVHVETAKHRGPFRGLVKPLKGREYKGRYRKVSGRYRIIFKRLTELQRLRLR